MATELQTTDPALPAEPIDLSGGILGVIARAARDPTVDIDKMERLLEMQERVLARQAKEAYSVALAELQPRLPIITERGKILNKDKQVQSTYAFWEDVNEAIRPLLSEHGFSLSFRTGRAGSEVTVTGVLTHRQGHSEETTITLPSDGSGNKNAVQAVASSTSYGKRYTAFALLNITTKGEDDDGQGATYKNASGEPLARTKLDGVHTSKTALRAAVHAIIASVRAAQSLDEISAIMKEHKPTIDQARRDWTALIDGDPNIPEDEGLRGALARRKEELAEPEEGNQYKMLIATMKECDTPVSLANWTATNAPLIEELDGAEARKFQLAYDLHASGIREMEVARA